MNYLRSKYGNSNNNTSDINNIYDRYLGKKR